MRSVRPPFFLRWFNPDHLLCRVPVKDKVLYLTFDDGPVPEATPEVLDILAERQVRATFFVVGNNVVLHPGIFNRLLQEGHAVGNHTFHHLNGWKTPTAIYLEDTQHCSRHIQAKLFRPPYGRFTPVQYALLRKDFRIVLWSVLTYDFDRQVSPQDCLSLAINHTSKGAIIVFHDSIKAIEKVRYALPRFIDHFLDAGYRFETLPQG